MTDDGDAIAPPHAPAPAPALAPASASALTCDAEGDGGGAPKRAAEAAGGEPKRQRGDKGRKKGHNQRRYEAKKRR